jgi:hypothetical protein
MENNEVELFFSDHTILEADSKFEEVNKIMESELWKGHKWMLETNLTIDSQSGVSEMILHLYHNKDIMIMEYKSSEGDVFYNPDIQALSVWASENGWNHPKPYIDLIKSDLEFWKHFWEVFLIDSDYLDERFGKRQIIYTDNKDNS